VRRAPDSSPRQRLPERASQRTLSANSTSWAPACETSTLTLTLRGGVHAGVDGADATRIMLAEIVARLG
jgi:hypothetical protein